MPDMQDITMTLPEDIRRRLLSGEVAYFYSAASGCLGFGGKEYFALTNRRVVMTAKTPGGCMRSAQLASVDIPLEQIASVSSSGASGCLTSGGVVVVASTGATHNRALVATKEQAESAAQMVQELLNARRA